MSAHYKKGLLHVIANMGLFRQILLFSILHRFPCSLTQLSIAHRWNKRAPRFGAINILLDLTAACAT
jgi:hypothetical protein